MPGRIPWLQSLTPVYYYFCIRECTYDIETKSEVYRYVGVVKLDLLTDNQADMVFQEALRPFIDAHNSSISTNIEAKKRFLRVSHLNKPQISKHVKPLIYTDYALKSEYDADPLTILQWDMISDSFLRDRYETALRQFDQTGYVAPTNETILAAAVRAAHLIQLPDSAQQIINLPEKPIYDIPSIRHAFKTNKKACLQLFEAVTALAKRDFWIIQISGDQKNRIFFQPKPTTGQKGTDTDNVAPSATPKSLQIPDKCKEIREIFKHPKIQYNHSDFFDNYFIDIDLEKKETASEIQEQQDSSSPTEREEADQNNPSATDLGSDKAGDDSDQQDNPNQQPDEEPRRGRHQYGRSRWIIKQRFIEKLTPAKIRDKWNSLKPEEREKIDPEHSEPYGKSSEEKERARGQIKAVIEAEKVRRGEKKKRGS